MLALFMLIHCKPLRGLTQKYKSPVKKEERMLKKLIASAFVVALSGASLMQPAHAGAILVKDFYANLDNGSQQLIGTVKVDVDAAQQWIDNVYRALSWSSFTLFGKEVDNAFLEAEFLIDDLHAGFTYLNIHVEDLLGDKTFKVMLDDHAGYAFADIFETSSNQNIYDNGVSVSNTEVISAPATTALMIVGFAGLMLRRRVQK
jgi:hypothetical protein